MFGQKDSEDHGFIHQTLLKQPAPPSPDKMSPSHASSVDSLKGKIGARQCHSWLDKCAPIICVCVVWGSCHIFLCTFGGWRLKSGVLNHSLPYYYFFFPAKSLAEPRANCLARLAIKLLESSCLLPVWWLQMCVTAPSFLSGLWGLEPRSSERRWWCSEHWGGKLTEKKEDQ